MMYLNILQIKTMGNCFMAETSIEEAETERIMTIPLSQFQHVEREMFRTRTMNTELIKKGTRARAREIAMTKALARKHATNRDLVVQVTKTVAENKELAKLVLETKDKARDMQVYGGLARVIYR